MGSEKFCLRWNDFETNISTAFRELREDKDFFDVTLACDDQQIQAHKVILSACSPFFRSVLKRNPHAHPLLYLRGVKYTDLLAVLNFMYHGEVNVAQEELNSFLAVAEELKVKGLTQSNNSSESRSKEPPPPPPKRPQHISDPVPPPPKRPRPPPPPQDDTDEIQEVALPPVKAEPQQYQEVEQGMGQVEEYGGEEGGYEEDYGHYEEGGDAGQYLAAGGQGGGADGNKDAEFTDPEQLYQFVEKATSYNVATGGPSGGLFYCTLCQKTSATRRDVRNHVESIHFPDAFVYDCCYCGKKMKTKRARDWHVQSAHKDLNVKGITSVKNFSVI